MAEEKTASQVLYGKAAKAGKVTPSFLNLTDKIEKGNGEFYYKSNGKHIVKFLSDKLIKKMNRKSQEEEGGMEYLFSENGLKKKYQVFAKSRNGELNYFVQKMSGFKIGDMISLEHVKKEGADYGFVDVRRATGSVPVIEQDEEGEEEEEEDIPEIEKEEGDIDTSKIPF